MKLNEIKSETITKKEINNLLSLPEIKYIDSLFRANNYELRIVGGTVRDLLLGNKPKDVDFCTDATPEEMKTFLPNTIDTGLAHGTITVIVNKIPFEITTLRIDTETDGRHATVEFTNDFKLDAARRDLTFNAMSIDMSGKIYDYYNGISDLRNHVARFVGDADARIKEDFLRILRYFRFQARMDRLNPDPETINIIKNNASGLERISGERIWAEMQKILITKHAKEILNLMDQSNVLHYISVPNPATFIQTNNAVANLASLLSNLNEVERVISSWKLSNPEKKLLTFLVSKKQDLLSLQNAKIAATNKTPKEYLYYLFLLQINDKDARNIMTWHSPDFPISGSDLLSLGYKPGQELGIILDNLKILWQKSNFSLSKDELIKSLGK